MSHHDNNSHYKQILSDVISLNMLHIDSLMQKIRKLDINDENFESKTQQEKDTYQMISNMLTIMNDAIHPAYNIAEELFPKAKEFVEFCRRNQLMAIERKVLPSTCNCYTCKIQKPI